MLHRGANQFIPQHQFWDFPPFKSILTLDIMGKTFSRLSCSVFIFYFQVGKGFARNDGGSVEQAAIPLFMLNPDSSARIPVVDCFAMGCRDMRRGIKVSYRFTVKGHRHTLTTNNVLDIGDSYHCCQRCHSNCNSHI